MHSSLSQAGLFSAVLTAFLVESYQRLVPDTSSQMLVVMQRMSLQLASFNGPGGMTISTYQPSITASDVTLQPFQPSPTDICINVLWFASLIFSLITASFGILVKQWLRGYLAVENPAPLARLRVRHYRWPGVIQWKVFEIAAVLPLLQQLSLALFFIGLCYFTSSVHESVGHASLPLVAGWAFCFTTVTILPVFFPRCPYKTTLLKSLFQTVHTTLTFMTKEMVEWWWLESRNMKHPGWLITWLAQYRDFLQSHFSKHDETAIVSNDKGDLDILAEVDVLQSNDTFIPTTIFDSLQQIHDLEWADVMNLVLQLLENRLPVTTSLTSKPPAPFYLRTLNASAYTGIIHILSHYFGQHMSSSLESDGDIRDWLSTEWSQRALYILFSPGREPLPSDGVEALSSVLNVQGTFVMKLLIHGCFKHEPDPSRQLRVLLQGLKRRAEDMNWTLVSSLRYLEAIIDTVFQAVRPHLGDIVPNGSFVLDGDVAAWPWHDALPDGTICNDATEFTAEIVRRAIHGPEPPSPNDVSAHTSDTDLNAVSVLVGPTSRQLTGAIACMWLLANKARRTPGMYWFCSAIGDCLSRSSGSLALLSAFMITPDSDVSGVCVKLIQHSSLSLHGEQK